MPVDDPIAARSPLAVKAFTLYLRWYFARNFHAVRIARDGAPIAPPDRPLIICSNHPGWWDPAMFILLLGLVMPGRVGYGPMDTTALAAYGILRKVGVFGIDPATRHGAAHFLRQGARILENPRAVLFVTAEGAFNDVRRRPITLRPGVAHLLRQVPAAVVLPLALEYPFWNERRPEALACFGDPIDAGPSPGSPLGVTAWNEALQHALTSTADRLAGLSIERDPAAFRPLIHGITGVGGLYDAWRRTTAWTRGKRFDSAHGATMQGEPHG
jgi:1-acyl-sn-glycerol-3-phosphate acyltransferase